MRPAAAALALALALAPVLTRDAHADTNDAITISGDATTALSRRLAQEMQTGGLAVQWEATKPEVVATGLLIVLPDHPADDIQIWRVRGASATLEASVPPDDSEDTRALRVAELVRALAFDDAPDATSAPEARPEPPPAPSPKPRPAPPKRVASAAPVSQALDAVVVDPKQPLPDPASFDFSLAAAFGLQTQGISMQIEGTAAYWPHSYVGAGIFASAPAVGAEVVAPQGQATVRSALFGVELVTAPVGRQRGFALMLSPGIALNYLHVSGTADRPFEDLTGDKPLAAAYGRAELRVRLAGPSLLKVGALGGASVPVVDIRFAKETVSTYSPFGTISLGFVVEP